MANLHALLIGVDHYMPNRLPGGSYYPSLGGCVRDVTHVEEFLKTRLDLPEARILKLLARESSSTKPAGPPETWPTYENMVSAFKKLTDMAKSGDQVYIHYAGHGGRAKTAIADLKGENGFDEALVPTDIGKTEARYLRDMEMAHLLKTMVDKGLIVTIVLDSCHSGGATRGRGGARVRGLRTNDTTPRPTTSLVASSKELTETWRSLFHGNTRNVKTGSGWLPQPQGYVLLAACRASESAMEYAFDGVESNGALTYWLLDSLKQLGPGLTYKMLHDRIIAKVHSQFEDQTPQLQGEGNRLVFGSDQVQPQFAVNVMQVDVKKKKVLLNTGQALTVRKGAQFAVYSSGVADFAPDKRLALVEIDELGATDSWAKITQQLGSGKIEQGAQAVLLDPGDIRLQRKVRLVQRDDLSKQNDQKIALKKVEEVLAKDISRFVLLADKSVPVEFQVVVDADGEYEIWDAAGKAISNLRPTIKVDERDAAKRVVQRLIHLTKFRNVQQLDNNDVMSPLSRKLQIELAGLQKDYDPVDKPAPQPFADPGNTPVLKPSEWTFLRVKNLLPKVNDRNNPSRNVLNVTVLDLQPDWGISQIFPTGAAAFEPLDPQQELIIPLQAGLPEGYETGTDVIKVFATVGATDFRVLELSALDQPPVKKGKRKASTNPLDNLLSAITADQPSKRNLKPGANPSREWVTAQVEVRVENNA
ncbi:caspase family protein [candidate division KSB1 bacterium]|nr:caspase family protein [candidate division KSB1 bacterium]